MSRPGATFVAVEGVDAVGKRTQTSLLKAWLEARGFSVSALSFPAYETPIGKQIRDFLDGKISYPPQVRAMLYAANRWEKKGELEATLSKTDVTIVDRYTGSNLAYGVSSGLALEWLRALDSGLPEPDLTLVLDAPLAKTMPRRGGTKDSYEGDANLQETARRTYLELAKRFGWTVVDAGAGIEEVGGSIRSAVSKALGASGRTI
ncbi:MAG: dTMP kinase [Nitrososphaerota archaeon]|nr:dTMP kinase [Nitrososphaerota archaeon]MDG6947626.1 dTMP kinase [Nitrososphaerota archaeon]